MASIKLDNISKWFGNNQVIKDVNLGIDDGEFVVLVGPSGCGKSTLLRIISGLEDLNGGSILINDEDVSEKIPSERGLSMVFQSYALYPHMNVSENIGFSLKTAGVKKDILKQKVSEVAEILKLENLLRRLPKELSGGQKQRVAIGRAIIREPKAFLFDEPLSNLDASLRVEMRLEIARLHKKLGITTIYVTHDQIEAMTMADEIVIMNNGIIEQIASPNEIYEKPNNLFVADFIGSPAINLLKGTATDKKTIKLKDQELSHSKQNIINNQNVVYGIRPTDINIDPSSNLKAEVVLVETTGSETHIIAMLDDNEFRVVQSGGRSSIKNGDTIPLSIDIEKAHIFDQSSSKRID